MSIELQRELSFIFQNRNEANQNIESVNPTQNPAVTKQEILALVGFLVTVLGKLENTLKKSIEKLAAQMKELENFEANIISGRNSASKADQKVIGKIIKNIKTIMGKEIKEIGALHSLVMSLEQLIKKPESLVSTKGEQLLAQILTEVENIAKNDPSLKQAQFQKA